MSKHTPGPWRYMPGGGHATNRIVGAGDIQKYGWPEPINGVSNASYSDTVCSDVGDIDLPGPAANAKLIAAAPELLAAARAAWNCIGELPPTQARVEVGAMLTAAIAKATGEA